MRVILAGKATERVRLRAALHEAGLDIVEECDNLADARTVAVAADAIVLARESRTPLTADPDAEWIPQPLTPREIDVVELLAEGLSNKSIAERLGISDQTVKFHLASISGKLGASNRTDIVRLALRRGLISL
jgi:DNA-binding NarL/FixJ family response regulator